MIRNITRLIEDQRALEAVEYLRSKGCQLADFQFLTGYLDLLDTVKDRESVTKALEELARLSAEHDQKALN